MENEKLLGNLLCKHFDPKKALRPGGIWCGYWGTDPDPEDWCCKGERRTDDRETS